MGIDLTILGLMAFFGLLGALSGASRQLAQIAALIIAGIFTKPLATRAAPFVTEQLGGPQVLGWVLASLVIFIALFSLVRWAVAGVLRRLLSAGEEKEQDGADRSLGFVIGAAKVALVAWLFTSAAIFAEEHIQIAGKRLSLAAKDSVAFALARTHNLFDYAQFAQARTFITLGQSALDPQQRGELTRTEGYRELRRDPRLRSALSDPRVREAIEAGDWKAALRNDAVMGLLQDRQVVALMEQAVGSLSGSLAGPAPSRAEPSEAPIPDDEEAPGSETPEASAGR